MNRKSCTSENSPTELINGGYGPQNSVHPNFYFQSKIFQRFGYPVLQQPATQQQIFLNVFENLNPVIAKNTRTIIEEQNLQQPYFDPLQYAVTSQPTMGNYHHHGSFNMNYHQQQLPQSQPNYYAFVHHPQPIKVSRKLEPRNRRTKKKK